MYTRRVYTRQDLERIGRIVNSSMDDLAVARGISGAEGRSGVENEDLSASKRQLSRHRRSHNARPNHHALHSLLRNLCPQTPRPPRPPSLISPCDTNAFKGALQHPRREGPPLLLKKRFEGVYGLSNNKKNVQNFLTFFLILWIIYQRWWWDSHER